MGKDKERNIAREMYVEQGKTAVEISRVIFVTEKTIGVWVEKEGWKALRNAKLAGKATRLDNIQRVIDDLVEQRLALTGQIKEAREANDKVLVYDLHKQAVALGDELSKYNKAKNGIANSNRITLEVYLDVMSSVFDELRRHDEKLHNATLDFQENHVQDVSKKLG